MKSTSQDRVLEELVKVGVKLTDPLWLQLVDGIDINVVSRISENMEKYNVIEQ